MESIKNLKNRIGVVIGRLGSNGNNFGQDPADNNPSRGQPSSAAATDIEGQGTNSLDLKDGDQGGGDDDEIDKAISGLAVSVGTLLFTGPVGVLFMFQPEMADLVKGLSYFMWLAHVTSVAANCLAMSSALLLLVYTLAYPVPSREATGTKRNIMYIGLCCLSVGCFSRIFLALPPTYRTPVILEVILGVIVGALCTLYALLRRFRKRSTAARISPTERFKLGKEPSNQMMETLSLLIEITEIEKCSDEWFFAASLLCDPTKRDLFIALNFPSARCAWIKREYRLSEKQYTMKNTAR